AQGGDAVQYFAQECRFVARALVARTRLVGCIGFQQQAFGGQGGDQLAQTPRAFVGYRAADADVETELPQLLCLFGAPREAVDHATQRLVESAQLQNHGLERVACVQHQWQIETAGDFELSAQEACLSFAVEGGQHVIKAALADRRGRVHALPCVPGRETSLGLPTQAPRLQAV